MQNTNASSMYTVISPLPVVFSDAVNRAVLFAEAARNRDAVTVKAFADMLAAALLVESQSTRTDDPGQVKTDVLLQASVYTAAKALIALRNSDSLQESSAAYAKATAKATSVADAMTSRLEQIERSYDIYSEAMKEHQATMAETSTAMDAWKGEVRKAADEAYKLEVTQKLWADRALSAQRDVRKAIIALVTVFLLPAIAVIFFPSNVGSTLHTLLSLAVGPVSPSPTATEIAAYTLSRVAIISVPIILYFWTIRLLVRYWTRSLLLQDDARARDTMLQTYRRLIEEKGAAPREDRAIVLSSIFRPIPGHGGEGVDNPGATEFINNFTPKAQ